MLQKIRDNSKGVLALGLMFLLFLSFAIWGIDFNFGQAASPVEVDGEPLPYTQVARNYQRQLSSYQQIYPNGIPALQLEEIKRGVLRASAQEEVVYRHAYEQGFRVSDQALSDYLTSQQSWQLGGVFSYDQFNLVAQQQGYSADQFKEVIRRALVTEQVRLTLLGSAFVTPAERERRGALEQETRKASYFVIPTDRYVADIAIDEAAIEAYYNDNKDQFKTIEAVKLEYIELNPDELAADMAIDEDELRAMYDAGVAAGSYVREETRKSSHILIGASPDDDQGAEAALTEAQSVMERINAGEDFAALAAEFSDDPGSKSEGGALDWSPRAAFVGPFSDALFSMEIGDVSEPIKTRFGYHIIRLDDVRADEVRTYDDVRVELAQDERLRLATTRVDELTRDLDDLTYEYDDTLTPAAEETDLPVGETGWITRASGTGIGADAGVREEAFSDAVFLDRRNSGSVRYRDGYLYLRVAEHRPVAQRDLADVRGEIEATLKREAAGEKAQEAGLAAQQKLTDGVALADVASELEIDVTDVATLQRRGGDAPLEISRAVFAAPAPSEGNATIGGTALTSLSYGVYVVEAVNPGDTIAQELGARYAQANGGYEFRAYIDDVYADADVKLNPDVLQ